MVIRKQALVPVLAVTSFMPAGAALAQDVMTITVGANVTIELDAPGTAKKLSALELEWELSGVAREQATELLGRLPGDALGAELACSALAERDGAPVAGVPFRFEYSSEQRRAGFSFQPPPLTRRSGESGSAFAVWDVDTGNEARSLLEEAGWDGAEISMKKKKKVDAYGASCAFRFFESCEPDATTLCLLDDRFKVTATFRDFDGTPGVAMAQERSDREGFFWFFNQGQEEFLVRLLNECSDFNRFWVFASGLTPLEHEITVTDTHTGNVAVYSNPLGAPSPPITDTNAFATCP